MELKWKRTASENKWQWGSNRTFMELKLQNLTILPEPAEGSNRTFMELKCKGNKGW